MLDTRACFALLFKVIEPPELEFINYFTDVPKPVEETPEIKPALKKTNSSAQLIRSDSKLEGVKSEGKISTSNSKSDLGLDATERDDSPENEVEEVKPVPRVGIEGPPIYVTLR
jgi:hypothetical protein